MRSEVLLDRRWTIREGKTRDGWEEGEETEAVQRSWLVVRSLTSSSILDRLRIVQSRNTLHVDGEKGGGGGSREQGTIAFCLFAPDFILFSIK